MANELPEYFDNIVLGQYAMTGVPLKVFANDRYYIIPSPEDVDDPLIGYGMMPSGKMEPFDYRDIEHIMVSGNKVDLATYTKALGDELEGVKKASDAKGGEEKKEEGGEEEGGEEAAGEEGGEEGGEAPKSPFESFDPFAKKWSLKALYEISKDEYNAQEDALNAEMEAGKAKIDAAKEKLSNLKKQPIDDGVIYEADEIKAKIAKLERDLADVKHKYYSTANLTPQKDMQLRKQMGQISRELKRAKREDKTGASGYKGKPLKTVTESVISDILIIAYESTTYEKFISELISQKLLKREDLRDPDLVDELKTMYRSQALGKRESVNELKLSSYGVKELLSAIYYNWNKLKPALRQKMHFNSFKDIIAYIKSGDQEEQARLKAFVQSQGIEIVALESVNETHISEPYIFQVGDMVRNINPQCKHYGSTGIVNTIQALDGDMGNIVKYIVTNFGDTFKPGMALMKTPEQLEPMDENLYSGAEHRRAVKGMLAGKKDPALNKGVDITIEMDDEDGEFSAGDYRVDNLTRGSVVLSGMGKTRLNVSFKSLAAAGYTINESSEYINEYGATPSKKNWLGWFVLNANLHGDLTAWKKGELIKAYKSDEKGYVFIYTGDYDYEAYDDISQSDFNRIATSLDPTKHKKSYNYIKKLEKLNRLKDYEVIN
jgi:hypothetical protein